jgi:hypothetical protein
MDTEPKYGEQRTIWYFDDVYTYNISEKLAAYRGDRMWWIPTARASRGVTGFEGNNVFFTRDEALSHAKKYLNDKIVSLKGMIAALG